MLSALDAALIAVENVIGPSVTYPGLSTDTLLRLTTRYTPNAQDYLLKLHRGQLPTPYLGLIVALFIVKLDWLDGENQSQ